MKMMTNRRKIKLCWEQLNHKHGSNKIFKGGVINILMLWRFYIILVEMRRATSHCAYKNKVRGKNIHLQSWEISRILGEWRSHSQMSGSTTAHLNIIVQGRRYCLELALRCTLAFMGVQTHPCLPQHLPATHAAPLQVLLAGSYCQAQCNREKRVLLWL